MIAGIVVTVVLLLVVIAAVRITMLALAAMYGLPFAVQAARRVHERYNFTPTVHRTLGVRAARDFEPDFDERPIAAYAEINVPRPRPTGEFIAESNVDLGRMESDHDA